MAMMEQIFHMDNMMEFDYWFIFKLILAGGAGFICNSCYRNGRAVEEDKFDER